VYTDDMSKKSKRPQSHEVLTKRFQMRLGPEEFAALEIEAAADGPLGSSLNSYIRKLLATHPDRPANKKKT